MELFYNLSLAYCSSFIFYIIQVYIPIIRNERKVISDLFSCLDDIYWCYNQATVKIKEINDIMARCDIYTVEIKIGEINSNFLELEHFFQMAELYMEK